MENQEPKRLEEIEIGIVDGIRFTVALLLAFLMDSEKFLTIKN